MFRVVIEDPDSRVLSIPEISVVENKQQWKFWATNNQSILDKLKQFDESDFQPISS